MASEIEVSENREALIMLTGTAACGTTSFVASLPMPLEVKAPVTVVASTKASAIMLYWKSKVNKQ